jgi:asparagine synthase (glutamine-hydrolysing)
VKIPGIRLLRRLHRKLFAVDLYKDLCEEDKKLISEIRDRRFTYLSPNKLSMIASSCRRLRAANVQGLFLEAGCALGGSSILISKLKDQDQPFHVFDVFGMIPPPSSEDGADVHERYDRIKSGGSEGIGGDTYYGYEDNLFDKVRNNFMRFGLTPEDNSIEMVQGLVQDTMNINSPVAFAHVDVDWYEPVMHCLKQVVPNLASGGSIILDDYYDWSGCRKAVDEYFRTNSRDEFVRDSRAGSMCITRK